MARVVINNTKFNPFTFDEILKPLAIYGEEYKRQEDTLNELSIKASVFDKMANEQKDPIAYKMYKDYSDALRQKVDQLNSEGLTPASRKGLLEMNSRYSKEMVPIETAYKKRETLATEQRQALANNPTLMYQRMANDMSLDDFINNPEADYGKSISGATLSAQVAAAASALAKEFRDNPDKMISLVGGDYYEYVKKRGFSSKAVLAAIQNSPNASPILTQLVESTIDSSGVKEWDNPNILKQAYSYANQGLWNAVGQDEAQLVQNWRAQENLSHAHAMSRQAAAHQMDLEKAYLTQSPTPYLKSDGTVGYYQPITKNSNGTYSRAPLPTDAVPGDLKNGGKNDEKPASTKTAPGSDVTVKSMRKAMTNHDQGKMKDLGYTPKYAVAYTSYGGKGYTGNNGWNVGENGSDHPGITGWAFHTNSNLITKWGNFTTNPINNAERSWVEDITKLPEAVQQELAKLDIPDDQDIQVQRVKRDGVNEGIEYDYIVYVKND